MKKIDLLFRLGCSTFISIAMVSASGISGSAYADGPPPYAAMPGSVTGILSGVGVIDGVINNPFDQPGGILVASPKSDKPCFFEQLLAGNGKSCDVVGGPWVRVMGGQTTTSTTAVTNPGSLYETSDTIRQRIDYTGVQTGVDSGLLNLEGIGVNAHVGVMGGKVSAQAKSTDSPSLNHVNFEVPFVGAYYVITKGNFMTDFTYRHSWYDMKVSDGLFFNGETQPLMFFDNTPMSGQSDSISASASYKFALPNRYFIEPMANISYTRSTFDSPSVGLYSTAMDLAPVTSLLGRAGFRFGTSFSYGGYNWAPYAIAMVENEFEKSSTASLTQDWGTLSTDRVGTFHQASLGISFQSQTNGLVGFARGDWQTGNKINGGGVVGGLRYTFGP